MLTGPKEEEEEEEGVTNDKRDQKNNASSIPMISTVILLLNQLCALESLSETNSHLGSQETHTFIETGSSLLCSHDPINGPYFEAFKLTLFLSHLFKYYPTMFSLVSSRKTKTTDNPNKNN
jgi:hypothetical protein